MLLNNNKQTKYFSLNTNDKTDGTKWNIPTNYNFSQKAKMALVSINNATDSNFNMVFCPTIKNNYFSSLNTSPLIYAGIGYNNQNIMNGKQYYDVNGAYLNEIELKTYSSAPQNDFSYPQLDGLNPIIWYEFDSSSTFLNENFNSTYNLTNGSTTFDNISFSRGNGSIKFLASSSQYATMPNGNIDFNAINIKNGISFCLWFKATSSSGLYSRIFEFGTGSSPTGTSRAIMIHKNALTTGISFSIFAVGTDGNAGSASMIEDSTNDYYNNTWYHIIWTISPTGIWNIYINGIKKYDNQQRIIIPPFTIANKAYYLGKSKHTSDGYFDGNIDDFRIYDFILNQDQANTIYTNTRINYPILKNEALKLANPADNDPNIHTIPNVWCRFETGALTTNSGTDGTIINNFGTTNEGVSVRGNNSVNFNGTNQYFYGTMQGFNNNSFSVSAWIYQQDSTQAIKTVLTIGSESTLNKKLLLGIKNTYEYYFGFYSNDFITSTTYSQDLNNWVHIVWVFDNNTKERMIYRNGVKLIMNGQSSATLTPTDTYIIGAATSTTYFYKGNIDDLRIYTGKVLDQEEITRIYNGAKTNYTTQITEPTIGQDLTPTMWYKFDNNLLDSSGNDNDLVLQTGAYTFSTNNFYRGNGSIKPTFTTIGDGVKLFSTNTYTIDNNNPHISISFWYNVYAKNAEYDVFLYSPSSGKLVIQRNGAQNRLSFSFNGTGLYSSYDNFTADNTWHHLVMIGEKVGTAVRIKYYIDGVFKEQNSETGAGTWASYTEKFGIFQNYSASQCYMDDLRVYVGTTLSQQQITDLYQGNTFYNLPTTLTRYNTNPTNTTYQFEIADEQQKIISHY